MSGRRAKLLGMRFRLAALPILLVTFLVVACGGSDEEAEPTVTPAAGAAVPAASGFDGALFIPSLQVGAPVTLKRFVVGQPLPSPDGPLDVAMYDFGSDLPQYGGAPGGGGNIVLSGQSLALAGCDPADPPCNGVFSSLRRLQPGADIDVLWQGETYNYQAVALCTIPTPSFGDELYASGGEELLTLLTGAGNWSSERGWSHVLIVIAKPAPRTAIEACPAGTSTAQR